MKVAGFYVQDTDASTSQICRRHCRSDSPTNVLTPNNEKRLKFRGRTLSPVMSEEDGQSLKLETTLITNRAGSESLLSPKPGK
jgi:hypothetical protein